MGLLYLYLYRTQFRRQGFVYPDENSRHADGDSKVFRNVYTAS